MLLNFSWCLTVSSVTFVLYNNPTLKAAATDMRYFAVIKFVGRFSSQGKFWLDMTSSFQVRTITLSR